jgi:hypothetical protein
VQGVKYADSDGENDEEEAADSEQRTRSTADVGVMALARLRPADEEVTARLRPADEEVTAKLTGEDKTRTGQDIVISGTRDLVR